MAALRPLSLRTHTSGCPPTSVCVPCLCAPTLATHGQTKESNRKGHQAVPSSDPKIHDKQASPLFLAGGTVSPPHPWNSHPQKLSPALKMKGRGGPLNLSKAQGEESENRQKQVFLELRTRTGLFKQMGLTHGHPSRTPALPAEATSSKK